MRQVRPISDYALIGDCRTAALVSGDGSIDWLCLPRFDSPSVFAALLDPAVGGHFAITPVGEYGRIAIRPYRMTRRYVADTAVLVTTLETDGGAVSLTDFMALPYGETAWGDLADVPPPTLVRLVNCLRGQVDLVVSFAPRLDYARQVPHLEVAETGVIAEGRQLRLQLASTAPLSIDGDTAGARLSMQGGHSHALVLSCREPGERATAEGLAAAEPGSARHWLTETVGGWTLWADLCRYRGPYRDLVTRSAITLKLLTYSPTGAIVAAPTTSLPEEIGGARNWDYRYTWLRDATFTLYALGLLGYLSEAADFLSWLLRAWGDPATPLQIMYGIDGRAELPEEELPHLSGYRDSRPVRVGNGAVGQLQLDIYGEVLDCAYTYHRDGGTIGAELWALLRRTADAAAAEWRLPDEGVWEVRGGRRHFTYSKVMCWVALERATRIAEALGLPADLATWRAARDEIERAVLEQGYNPAVGAFTQAFGSSALDASLLRLPQVGFIDAHDPRMRATIEAIDARLTVDGLVYRYRDPVDGLAGNEGTFAICTFWLIDCLLLLGNIGEARRRFERVVGYANDLGLLAEEIDPHTGTQLGNFPQAFTHIALINTAVNLEQATSGMLTPPWQRATEVGNRQARVGKGGESKG
jgi:GH15 family glucan-1,4-alpha-glucosidase